MTGLSIERLRAYRAETFRTLPHLRLTNVDQAVDFVNERGFVFFWPIRDVVLPSLWTAAAGDRPVGDAHDDPGHITWDWKDSLLGKHRWYYGRVLRRRNTIISLEMAPHFYALSENYGSPEEDYLILYEQGRMTQESKAVYEALLNEGPLDTLALRRAARLSSRENDSRFNRALDDLQIDFKALPVGISDVGAWHYAFVYDIPARHFPSLPDEAHNIEEKTARQKLAERYWRSLGAAPLNDYIKCMGWKTDLALKALDALEESRVVRRGFDMDGKSGEWAVLAEIL